MGILIEAMIFCVIGSLPFLWILYQLEYIYVRWLPTTDPRTLASCTIVLGWPWSWSALRVNAIRGRISRFEKDALHQRRIESNSFRIIVLLELRLTHPDPLTRGAILLEKSTTIMWQKTHRCCTLPMHRIYALYNLRTGLDRLGANLQDFYKNVF